MPNLKGTYLFNYFKICELVKLHHITKQCLENSNTCLISRELFCVKARNKPDLLKNMCIKLAEKKEQITDYDPSEFENLSCKEDDEGKVLLEPHGGGDWVPVQDALLICNIKVNAETIKRALGKGIKKMDVFKYVQNEAKTAWIADGNLSDFLKDLL